jgi:hypothetical protein
MLLLAFLMTCSPVLELPIGPAPTGVVRALDGNADKIKSLLKKIEKRRDQSNASLFQGIAAIKTKGALKALKKSVTLLREERATSYAYAAFAEFKGVEDLEQEAIDYLVKAALGNRRRESAPAAAAALASFGAVAVSAAEEVAAESGDAEVRWAAIKPLLVEFGKRGNVPALTTILDSARPALDDEVEEVRKALGGVQAALALEAHDRSHHLQGDVAWPALDPDGPIRFRRGRGCE